jgi:hypothetical protein
MNLKQIALVLVLGLVGMGAQAQKKKALVDEVSGQGYGMAGCGLGSVVFGDKPGLVQVVSSFLNGTSGNQTFGISFGTSNCEGMMKSAKTDQFIEVNKLALEKEMVRGQGENMSSLQNMMGCQNETFSNEMTANYKRGFPQGNASVADLNKIAIASCEL